MKKILLNKKIKMQIRDKEIAEADGGGGAASGAQDLGNQE